MKHFGYETLQDLIDTVMQTGQIDIYYKKTEYTIWIDGCGFNIGRTDVGPLEHEETIKSYETIEELIDGYVLYDGTLLSTAMELDVSELGIPEYD